MWNSKARKILLVLLLLQPIAFAKRRPPKAFSFIVDAGKASQGECDGEWKIPRKLKHLKDIPKSGSYLGSELQEGEMWKHFFRDKASCNGILAKTPSALDDSQKTNKPNLPPDESSESEQNADEGDRTKPEPNP